MRSVVSQLDVRQLEVANAAALRWLWREVNGADPPRTFTARLMRLALAWDAQAAREGSEKAKARRDWNRINNDRVNGRRITHTATSLQASAGVGTLIIKEWAGTTHEVMMVEGGATWNGKSYSSLSAVARAMTGTNRNGPKFFGLRECQQ